MLHLELSYLNFELYGLTPNNLAPICTSGKHDSGKKFTSPKFCVPFVQTVNRPVYLCKWQTTPVIHLLWSPKFRIAACFDCNIPYSSRFPPSFCFKIDAKKKKSISLGISGGKEVMEFANTGNRG